MTNQINTRPLRNCKSFNSSAYFVFHLTMVGRTPSPLVVTQILLCSKAPQDLAWFSISFRRLDKSPHKTYER